MKYRSEYQIWNDEINGIKTPLSQRLFSFAANLAGFVAFVAIVLMIAFCLKVRP